MTIAIGSSISVFANLDNNNQNDGPQASSTVSRDINFRVALMCTIGAAAGAASYLQMLCWAVSGARIAASVQQAYFASLIHNGLPPSASSPDGMPQSSKLETAKVTEALSIDASALEDALCQKAPQFLHALAGFLSAFVIAFVRNWKLALVLSSVLPAMFIPIGLMSRLVARNSRRATELIAEAHTAASDAISAVRVVQDMQAEGQMTALYKNKLQQARTPNRSRAFWQAIILGWVFFVLYVSYGLAMWQGANLLISDSVDVGIVTNVLFAIILGIVSLGRVSRLLPDLAVVASIGGELFRVIDSNNTNASAADERKGEEGPLRMSLVALSSVGDISFRDVAFAFPSRPSHRVLDGINLDIPFGQTTAIVGSSGAGKSTLVSLLLGLNTPLSGRVSFSKRPISCYDPKKLRNIIAYLPQEPRFFTMSVYENVRLGLMGTPLELAPESAQRQAVTEACAAVGLKTVIGRLPCGYDTIMGMDSASTAMSGGEKQRLAIARALVRNPSLLILDEPTSALDRESELVVQETIDRISTGRSVIIIAHRLNTIQKADSIVVLDKGTVAERGSHRDLLAKGGLYASLLQAQDGVKKKGPQSRGREGFINHPNPLGSGEYDASWDDLKASEKTSKDGISENGRPIMRQQSAFKYIWRILRLNRPELLLLVLGHIASVISAATYPFQAYLFAQMIALSASPIGADFHASVARYALLFAAVAIAKGASSFAASWALGICCDRAIERARCGALAGTLQKSAEWFLEGKHDTPGLVFALLNQGAYLAGLHSSSLAVFSEISGTLTATAIFSIVLAWKYALVLLSVVPLVFVSGYARQRISVSHSQAIIRSQAYSSQIANESVALLSTVQSYNAQDYFCSRYTASIRHAARLTLRHVRHHALLFSLTQTFVFLVNAFAIWYGTRLVTTEGLGLFEFFAIFIALTFGAQDTGEMLSRLPDLTKATAAARVLFEKLDAQNTDQDKDKHLLAPTPGPIDLQNISFEYPRSSASNQTHPAALHDITISIPSGKHVALVGPSGSGKSTLLSILSHSLTPSSGSLFVSHINTSLLSPRSLRALIATVPQEPTIFSGTVRFNLVIGNPRATDAGVADACRRAEILEFVESLPEGMDTVLCGGDGGGEGRGGRLSVGQKQRLAIARALVRRPAVLLMDEPTAALDAGTAKRVMGGLLMGRGREGEDMDMSGEAEGNNKGKEMTIVTVGHTAESVRHAHVVYMLREGRVVKVGTPEEVMMGLGE
jgi:ATP-binding cassette subfamily B (MDR/TAP) protein 1